MAELRLDGGKKIAALIFLLMFFGYPLFSSIAVILDVPNRFLVIPYRSLVLMLSIYALIPLLCRRFRFSFFTVLLIVFWFYYISRLVVDGLFSPWMFETKSLLEYWLFAVGVSLLPSMAVCYSLITANEGQLSNSATKLGFVALVLCFFAYFQSKEYDISAVVFSRYETEVLNPISFGHMCVSLAVFAVYSFCFNKGRGKLFSVFVAILSLIGILLSGSRGPLLSFLFILACAVFALSKRVLIFLPLLCSLFLGCVFYFFHDLAIFDRFTSGFFNDPARSKLFFEAVDNVSENFFLGAGISPMESYPHNLLLESFMVLGVGGGILFTLIMVVSIVLALINVCFGRERLFSFLYIQYFLYVLVSGSLHEVSVFWMLTFIILLRSSRRHQSQNLVAYG